MTKGLFTSSEEITFHNVYVKGHISSVKASSKNRCDIHQENKRIAQNMKHLNRVSNRVRMRVR